MAVEFKLPSLGENIESGEVVAVLVAVGDTISVEQPVLELETDKATVEVPSDVDGVIEKIHVTTGEAVAVGQTVLTVDGSRDASQAVERQEVPSEESAEADRQPEQEVLEPTEPVVQEEIAVADSQQSKAVPASPSVRRFAREIGVQISQVAGSGPAGRITLEDVKSHSRGQRGIGPGSVSTVQLPDFSVFGEIESTPFNNVRRVTAHHLSEAWANVAHVTQHDRADVTDLEQLRKRYAEQVGAMGGKLTVTAIALKILAVALKQFPKFNGSIDIEKQEVVFKNYYNIGVAVDTEKGLLVPVIRNVDQKNIIQLAQELKELAEKTRNGKISPNELQGGTFTVTNLGGIGGTSFTPIVNFPEVAILGISRALLEPTYIDGTLQPRQILPLSLSYDHRLIDGAEAARFLRWVAEAFEEPFLLALEG
jgi:pyruvate dehydrogenase E2 component (dihydrolipoamide acetyltransferase)